MYHGPRFGSTECEEVCKGQPFPQVLFLSPLPLYSHLHLYILVTSTSGIKDMSISYLTCIKTQDKALSAAENRNKELCLRQQRVRNQILRSRPCPWVQGPWPGHCQWLCTVMEAVLLHPPCRATVKHSIRETFEGLMCLENLSLLHSSLRRMV